MLKVIRPANIDDPHRASSGRKKAIRCLAYVYQEWSLNDLGWPARATLAFVGSDAEQRLGATCEASKLFLRPFLC